MDPTSEGAPPARTRIRHGEVVADLAQRALEADDVDQLLHDASVAVAAGVDTDFCAVFDGLPGGDECLLRAGVGWRDGHVGTATVSADPGSLVGCVLRDHSPVVVEDRRPDERFDAAELLTSHDVVGGVGARIGPADRPWGVLGTYAAEPREFAEHEVALVRRVADVLASAIDRLERERELERKERRYEAVFDDPNILVGLLDPDGTVIDINETAMEYVDADLDAVAGEPFWETPWWDDGDDVRSEVREWVDRAADGEYVDFEADLARPDGERFAVSGYFRPVTDADGDVVSIIVSDRDVTERKERERELAQYETLFEESKDVNVIVDADGTFRYLTPSAAAVFGYEPGELVGEVGFEYIHPDDREEAMAEFATMIESSGYEPKIEFRFERSDGSWIVLEALARDLRDDPDIGGIVVYTRDVTARKERERELEQIERRYRTLVENFPNGAVALVDDELRYRTVVGDLLAVDGLASDELEDQPIREAIPPALAEALVPRYRAALDGESNTFEYEDGGRTFQFRTVPIRDDEGTVFSALGMSQDVTERKERERELERALDLLEQTERTADVGGWEIDVDTMDVYWSDHLFEILDVPHDEEPPLGEALDVYHEEDRPIVEDAVEAALETGDPFDLEVRVPSEDGVRWLRVQGAPETVEGDVVSLRGAAQDITERKEYERKLEASNERLEQFAYAASHDLQEPLRMVSSYLQLLEDRYAEELDEDAEEFIGFAVDGADRMRDMIEGLLAYSRVDSRGDPFGPVDLDAVFADVRQDLRVTIERSDAEITAEALPRVYGDGGQLNQVLQNLLSNAIEYSGEGPPRVHVSAERDGDEWVISVSDEGIGIDPEDAERVFEVFQSLHAGDRAGTGIGLALCERIVERHGGDIWVESEPGEGATFSFTLPAVD